MMRPSKLDISIGTTDRWYVQLDGKPVAIIQNPADADMFWFTWDLLPIEGTEIPSDLWDYATDSRRSFRHVDTGELDPSAFPGAKGLLESGRVMIRGPLRNRERLVEERRRSPLMRIRGFIRRLLGDGEKS